MHWLSYSGVHAIPLLTPSSHSSSPSITLSPQTGSRHSAFSHPSSQVSIISIIVVFIHSASAQAGIVVMFVTLFPTHNISEVGEPHEFRNSVVFMTIH